MAANNDSDSIISELVNEIINSCIILDEENTTDII